MLSQTDKRRAVGPRRHRGGALSWTWVVFSSIAIAGYFVGQYGEGTLAELAPDNVGLATTYAVRPWPVQIAFYDHIVFAGLSLVLGPWQFARGLRRRRPGLHRAIGRAYMICIALGSVGAFVMSFFSSAGFDGFFGFCSLDLLWAWTAWRGYRAARERDIRSHQAWMLRNFALTYAAVTLRLWLGTLLVAQLPFVQDDVAYQQIWNNAYNVIPFLCWLPNIVVAELMVRRRGLPALRLVEPPRVVRAAE
ncbi:DUF2306 domain-containing protein [Streptomyces fuscigenes]|uniref:DUF2306 domain-containing protein n=1 Tax=Streptomyces fuscigenes TaxID=1528880 RepID=UPI001F188AB1|nr:DUF2306 domain-containing protein [Streptomyces fuscigenes]MCF3961467.1 DUF2306 domain-containing protein [Streptomyces fuscigenes]